MILKIKHKGRKIKAFTIIEALVAVSVIAVAIIAPLTLASRVLFVIKYSEDQMIASALAQEQIELARRKRDTALIDALRDPAQDRYKVFQEFGILNLSPGESRKFVFDIRDFSSANCNSIESECARVYNFNDLYVSEPFLSSSEKSSAKLTRFKRILEIKKISDNEAKLISKVKWRTGYFPEKELQLEEIIYNWAPPYE